MAANSNFDAILTTTLNNYRRQLEDNIFTARPFVAWLQRKDRIRKISGGAKIVEPLVYAVNSTAGSYSGYDTLSTTAQTGISAAEYSWKQFAATIAINGLEEAQNNGEAAILNLLEAKTMQAEETISEKLDEMFFLDGTGNSNKDWLGLAQIVGTTTSVGGIDGNTDAFWRSTVDSTTEALTIADLNTLYNTISRGNDHPDFELTTQALYEKYESLLQPQLRFTDTKTADAGFQNLMHKGAVVMFDSYCQSGTWYQLNSKNLKLVGHEDKWFTPTPFVKPNNQDARFAQILCYGNLTTNNRARLGKLTNKS